MSRGSGTRSRRGARRTSRSLPTAVALLLGGCLTTPSTDRVEPTEDVLLLEVAPETVECVGEAIQRCLRVRRLPAESWENFYGRVEGFEHESGFRYLLEVARRPVPFPPADGLAFTYRLIRVLEREPSRS